MPSSATGGADATIVERLGNATKIHDTGGSNRLDKGKGVRGE